MRRVRLDCKVCKFYRDKGFSKRCVFQDNLYENWLGTVYKKHPTEKNVRGKCEDYEEINN